MGWGGLGLLVGLWVGVGDRWPLESRGSIRGASTTTTKRRRGVGLLSGHCVRVGHLQLSHGIKIQVKLRLESYYVIFKNS